MNLLYIAGRYRGHSREAVDSHVAAAKFMAEIATEKGWFPVVPHLNTYGFEHSTERGDEFWLNGTLELMRRCDAVLLVPGWEASSGTRGEIEEARKLTIPVYRTFEEMPHAAQ